MLSWVRDKFRRNPVLPIMYALPMFENSNLVRKSLPDTRLDNMEQPKNELMGQLKFRKELL